MKFEIKELKVRLTFIADVLGTSSSSPDLYETYIASKLEGNPNVEEELKAVERAVEVYAEKAVDGEDIASPQTVFPRDEDGVPFVHAYQVKGFFKDSCGVLKKIKGSESSKIKAYKKEIDGLIFPYPDKIIIHEADEVGFCSRPLRGQTPQGERIAIAKSESIRAGSWLEFTIKLLQPDHEKLVREWLEYGEFRGLGQWRNSGKGRFTVEYLD